MILTIDFLESYMLDLNYLLMDLSLAGSFCWLWPSFTRTMVVCSHGENGSTACQATGRRCLGAPSYIFTYIIPLKIGIGAPRSTRDMAMNVH